MRVRVGVNGMGRIGRDLLRIATGRAAAGDACFEVVAVNDLAQPETVAHLLKHDSTYGAWSRSVDASYAQRTADLVEMVARRLPTL